MRGGPHDRFHPSIRRDHPHREPCSRSRSSTAPASAAKNAIPRERGARYSSSMSTAASSPPPKSASLAPLRVRRRPAPRSCSRSSATAAWARPRAAPAPELGARPRRRRATLQPGALACAFAAGAGAGGLDEACEPAGSLALEMVAHLLPDADARLRKRGHDAVAMSDWHEPVAVAPQRQHRPVVVKLAAMETRGGGVPRRRGRLVCAACARRPAVGVLAQPRDELGVGQMPFPTTTM